MPVSLAYPNVNGLYPDWARVSIGVFGGALPLSLPTKGFRAISYKDRTNGELAMGNSQLPNGQTSGQIIAEMGSISMLLPEYQKFRLALSSNVATGNFGGTGAYTALFNLLISYSGVSAAGLPYSIKDFLYGCRMAGSDNSHRSSGGALDVTFPFQPTFIAPGGVLPDDLEDFEEMQAAFILLDNAIGVI